MKLKRLLPLLAVILAASLALTGRAATKAPGAGGGAPKLVVLLVVDQMRGDYPLKYGSQWKDGLRRLLDKGAWFQQAAYPYFYTVTCAGHETISTGAFPRTHGIIGNSWFDRASGKNVDCTSDAAAQTISYGRPVKAGESPARLMTSTLADNLRAQLPVAPRVVTMSMKERTAIMLAGRRGDAVTWFDTSAGSFATSSVYTPAPVPFVEKFVKAHPVDDVLKQSWVLKQPAKFYVFSDTTTGERAPSFWTPLFPHALRTEGMKSADAYEAWTESPFSDAYLGELAAAAVDSLRLGRGPGTDFLAVSFSALDLVGHDFGPQSYEVQDVLLRLDGTIGSLLENLDRTVGSTNYVVALAGDHGVSPIPEQMSAQGVQSGRVTAASLVAAIQRDMEGMPGEGGKAVTANLGGQIYLSPDARRVLASNQALRDKVVQDLEQIPGVAKAVFTDQLTADNGDAVKRAVMQSFFAGRSADLVVVQQPYWLFGNGSAASHGTPYRYDTWVPLVFYGSRVKAGRFVEAVTPADLAPTLAWMCGVTLPHTDGRPLLQAVQTTSAVPAAPTLDAHRPR